MRELIEGNVPIPQVNVGNMHASEGKRQLTSAIFVDRQDEEDLNAIVNAGIRVYLQPVPTVEGTEYKGH